MEEQVVEFSTTWEAKRTSKIRTTCVHGSCTSYGYFHEYVDRCTHFYMIKDVFQTPGNQGGFLEISSIDSPNHVEKLAKLQEDDQVSQTRMEENNYPCLIPSLINDYIYFWVLKIRPRELGWIFWGRWGIKEEVLVLMTKTSFNHSRLKKDPDM